MKTIDYALRFTLTVDSEGNVGKVSGICGAGSDGKDGAFRGFVDQPQLFLAAYEMLTGNEPMVVFDRSVFNRHIDRAVSQALIDMVVR